MLIAELEQITLQTESSGRARRDIVNDMQPAFYPVLRVQQIPRIEHMNATLSVNSVMANDFSAGVWAEGDAASGIF